MPIRQLEDGVVWAFFYNVFLRLLSDVEYVDLKYHIQHIAWAWNTTHNSSTSVRPFEVMHGVTPVTLTNLLVLNALSTKVMNVDNIREAASAYAQIARENGDYMRKRSTEILNSKERKLKPLKLGD